MAFYDAGLAVFWFPIFAFANGELSPKVMACFVEPETYRLAVYIISATSIIALIYNCLSFLLTRMTSSVTNGVVGTGLKVLIIAFTMAFIDHAASIVNWIAVTCFFGSLGAYAHITLTPETVLCQNMGHGKRELL